MGEFFDSIIMLLSVKGRFFCIFLLELFGTILKNVFSMIESYFPFVMQSVSEDAALQNDVILILMEGCFLVPI